MAFTFPVDKKDFTGDNGITYHWDGEKWVVKSYEITAINDIGEEVSGLAQRISDGEEAQEDLDGRVSRGESAQTQIATQVIDNKNAIDELRITKGSVSKYEVKQVSVGVASRNGELIVDSPNAADVTFISFAPFDVNGQQTKPIQTGDIIEFIEATARSLGDVTRYRVKDAPNQQSVSVDYLAGTNDFAVGEPEECYIYPQNEETASVEYVDAQDALKVNLAGTNEVTAPWKIKSDSKTYISANADELRLYHVADPTDQDDGWAANKGYVDSKTADLASEEYVDSKTAGLASEEYVDDAIAAIPDSDLSGYLSDTGQQDLNTAVWKIRQQNSEGAFRSFINIHNGAMNLYNVVNPSGSGHEKWAANKEYVDTEIASINSNVNLDNYLPLVGGDMTGRIDITLSSPGNAAIRTIGSVNVKADGASSLSGDNNFIAHKDYVRVYSTPVAAADVVNKEYADSTFVKQTARPGLRFGFQSGSSAPGSGKFTWYSSGGQKLKINATTKNGIPWAVDTPIVDFNFGTVGTGPTFAIWATVTGTNNWRLKRFGYISRIDFHADDILCYISSDFTENGSFSTSAEYNITIAGLI